MGWPSLLSIFLIEILLASALQAQEKSSLSNSEDLLSRIEVLEVLYDSSDMGLESSFFSGGSVNSISKEELEKFNYSDPNRALQSIPGLFVQEEDGFGLRPNIGLRGTPPHRSKKITLMEDGILIAPAPYSAPAAYYFPNMMRVSQIDVFKGVSSTSFGPQSIGGAVHFKTNPIPQERQLKLAINYGLTRKYEASIGEEKGNWGYFLEYNRLESDGFKRLPNGEDTGFSKNDLLFKGAYKVKSHHFLVKISSSMERSHETYLGLTLQDFKKSSRDRYAASAGDLMRWDHSQYQLDYSTQGSFLNIKGTLYHNIFNRNWSKFDGFKNGVPVSHYLDLKSRDFDPHFLRVLRGESNSSLEDGGDHLLVGNNDRQYGSGGAQVELSSLFRVFGLYNDLSLGLRYHEDFVQRKHSVDEFQMLAGRRQNMSQRRVGDHSRDSARARSLWLNNEVSLSDKLRLFLSFRLEDARLFKGLAVRKREPLDTAALNLSGENILVGSDQKFIPGLGLQYFASMDWSWFLGVNRGVSIRSPSQVASGGRSEESVNYEGGVEYKGFFNWKLIGFYNDYMNITGLCSFSSGCQVSELDKTFHGGRAQIYGFEGRIGKSLSLSSFQIPISLNYSMVKSSFLENRQSDYSAWGIGEILKGDPLPYLPQYKFSLSLGIIRDSFSSTLFYNGQSSVYDQSVRKGRKTIGAYGVWDWVAQYRYSESGRVFLRVENLLNNNYLVSLRPYGARPGKPQLLSVGLSHVFQ